MYGRLSPRCRRGWFIAPRERRTRTWRPACSRATRTLPLPPNAMVHRCLPPSDPSSRWETRERSTVAACRLLLFVPDEQGERPPLALGAAVAGTGEKKKIVQASEGRLE